MNFVCTHLGDIHLEEDHYFADTAQCLEWFVADAVQSYTNLFVVNGDLTTYKATIKERNVWVSARPSMTTKPLEVSFKLHGTLLISWAGDGSCEAFQPPPSASINPPLAVIC